MSAFIGRESALAVLRGALSAQARDLDPSRQAPDRRMPSVCRPTLVLVSGEAGMGKTALLTAAAADSERATQVAWGTCWDADRAPAFWPWTQILRGLLGVPGIAAALPTATKISLTAVLPELAAGAAERAAPAEAVTVRAASVGGDPRAERLQVFAAVAELVDVAARAGSVMLVVDDVQWSDPSSVDLLRFLSGRTYPGRVLMVGAYRPSEVTAELAEAVGSLASSAESIALGGLTVDEVGLMATSIAGEGAAAWSSVIFERTAGQPFFTRELCHLLAAGGGPHDIPVAARELITRRIGRLSAPARELLDLLAVLGNSQRVDLLGSVSGADDEEVVAALDAARAAGAVAVVEGSGRWVRFAHDLYRETVYEALPPRRRQELHARAARYLNTRQQRGDQVFAGELARHFAVAAELTGAAPAMAWARTAAEADASRFAFVEAAGYLFRARQAVAGLGRTDDGHTRDVVRLLVAEAELRLRAGQAEEPRALLGQAWTDAVGLADPELMAAVALGTEQVGARFAMPRNDLVAVLEESRAALDGTGTALEAQVTAALARQLQHSVPKDRPRARPLAARAVAVARQLDDPVTLAQCLLAEHDVLWTPGTARQRWAIAEEIAAHAESAADLERQVQSLLLAASAQLESGSPAFRATLASYANLTEHLHQPRHDYLLRTRQAAVALLDGDLVGGDRMSAEAAVMGEAAGELDTGNVRMSQRIEVVRARNDPDELVAFAAEAVHWWVGAPEHAHAVAAGFYARAGALGRARRELDTAVALAELQSDRSYLWSVFVGELATAAIALADDELCRTLLAELEPIADSCAVNGALVCFMGSHAHRVGLLLAALGDVDAAENWLRRGLETHQRLGAGLWVEESSTALAAIGQRQRAAQARLTRQGTLWEAGYRGRTVLVRDSKGIRDLAVLLARPGVDVPALDLVGSRLSQATGSASVDPVLDRTALAAYRSRLADLTQQIDEAAAGFDLGTAEHARSERERLLAELHRVTRPDGRSRAFGNTATERARKATSARIRDAIGRITEVAPDLGQHLDRTVRTGTSCRYDPTLDQEGRPRPPTTRL